MKKTSRTSGTRAGREKPHKESLAASPRGILAIDIGGSKIKVLASGQTVPRKARSGHTLTPNDMVETVQSLAKGWDFEAISIGYPGMVGDGGPRSEPENLGPGWMGFDFAAAFKMPVRIINDAAMQALGSYDGGRMLFLGLGTGLGSALIADGVIVPLQLGRLHFKHRRTLGEVFGRPGLKRMGLRLWRRVVVQTVPMLMAAFQADYVMIGGGNARRLTNLPPGVRLGHNLTAFRGGFRLWNVKGAQTHSTEGPPVTGTMSSSRWKLI